ncbi:MAG: ATP-binding protein [Gammaproteobacteria bacterium]|nr:ATP-binding protein [Gammaproteobacteria bacterium]
MISSILWYALVIQSNSNLKHIADLHSQYIADDVSTHLELRISALKHLAKHLDSKTSTISKNPLIESSEVINQYSGIEYIVGLNSSLQILWSSSRPNHDKATTSYADFINQYHSQLITSLSTQQVWLSNPIAINQTDKAIVVVIPTSNGFLIGNINLNAVFELELNNINFNVSILDNEIPVYQYGLQGNPSSQTSTSQLDLYGSTIKIVTTPSNALAITIETYLPLIALFLGIFVAILFAITTRLAFIARQRALTLDQTNASLTREITERQQAEESKHSLERALLQGQKLQAIGTLAGGIAHDFNNILYAIIGYTEMAQEDVPKDGLIYNNLAKVLEGAHRGQELISRILTFSRRQIHEFKPINLAEAIEGALSLIKPAIPSSIMIKFIIEPDSNYMILGNQTQLHQILINLINNAVDAMGGEGEIDIKLNKASSDDPFFAHSLLAHTCEYYKIEIKDAGCGMDASLLERIFEPFFTTKEVGKGTGLGLSTVHAITKEHQGDIMVSSQLGEGTTFTIFLPAYEELNKQTTNT